MHTKKIVCCRRIVIFDLLYRIFVFLLLMHISSWQLTAHTLHKIPTIIIIKQKKRRRSRRPNKTQRSILNIFWPRRKTKARRIIMKNKRDFIFILDKNLCFVACFYLSAHNLVGCCCCCFFSSLFWIYVCCKKSWYHKVLHFSSQFDGVTNALPYDLLNFLMLHFYTNIIVV